MIFQETPSTKPRTNQQKPRGLVQGAGSHTCKDTYLERPAASFQVSARRGQLRAMRTSTLRRFLRRPPQKLENNPGRGHLRSGLTGRLRRGNYPLLCLGCEPAMGPHGLPRTLGSGRPPRGGGPRHLALRSAPGPPRTPTWSRCSPCTSAGAWTAAYQPPVTWAAA